jgi:uncharacterized membrane protein HdeD (DUF308 family)
MHEAIDPVAGIVLILSSWIFNFSSNGKAQAVTIILGAVMLIGGSMTDWRMSLARVIPLRAHFMTDVLIGIVLIIAPFVFGFHGNAGATRFCVIFGVLELVAALGTSWDHATDFPSADRRRSGEASAA